MIQGAPSIASRRSSDVIVVGGGVIGLAIALHLARRGVKVTILERGRIGREASLAAAGILAAQADMEQDNPLTPLCLASREMYAELAQDLLSRTGIDIEHSRSGLIYVAMTDREAAEIDARHFWQRMSNLAIESLAPREILSMEPSLNGDLAAGLHFPDEASVNTARLLTALERACVDEGVTIVTGAQVLSVCADDAGVTGLTTSTEEWSAGSVVIAAGCWSGTISTPLGCEPVIQPCRGQIIVTESPTPPLGRVIFSTGAYLVPRRDGTVLHGSTVEFVGYDTSVTLGGIQKITAGSLSISSTLGSRPIVDIWSGLRPHYSTRDILVGPAGIEGLYYATGHFRNGILLAPITAALISESIVTGIMPGMLAKLGGHST